MTLVSGICEIGGAHDVRRRRDLRTDPHAHVGETPTPIVTQLGTIPAGGKTTENHFRFSNAILRTGIGQEIPIDTLRGTIKSIRLKLGLGLRCHRLHARSAADHVTRINARTIDRVDRVDADLGTRPSIQ